MMADQRMSWVRRSSDSPAASTTFSSGLNAHQQPTLGSGKTVQTQMTDVDALNTLLRAILQNPHLEKFGTIVLTYLRVDNNTFRSICQLRNDSLFQRELHPYHPSIFVSPPRDLWESIVRLRFHHYWHNFRFEAIRTVKQALIDELNAQEDTRYTLSNPNTSTTTSSIARSSTDDEVRPTASPRLAKAREQRTAPSGQCWSCPSRGCTRKFQKRGHLDKHIGKTHPDFLDRNPGWTPNHNLEPASTERYLPRDNSSLMVPSPGDRTSTASTVKMPQLTVNDNNSHRAGSMSVSSSASISSISNTQSAISNDLPSMPESNIGEWQGDFVPNYGPVTHMQEMLPASVYESSGVSFPTFPPDMFYTDEGQPHQSMEMELSYSERLSLEQRGQQHPTASPRRH